MKEIEIKEMEMGIKVKKRNKEVDKKKFEMDKILEE